MASDFELATLIVAVIAIALTLSPTSITFFASIFSTALRLIIPRLGTCERLEWQDVHDGPLHTCASSHSCEHIGPAEITPTWDRTLATFFRMRRGNFVRKPKQLNLTTKYIRTDTRTLKVFMSLLNLRRNGGPFSVGEEPFRIVFKEADGLLTAYIQVRHSLPALLNYTFRMDATKQEMEMILQGYPPWYQDPLVLAGSRTVPHPIRDQSDLQRGGWIVAAGLSPTLPVAADFMTRKEHNIVIVDRAVDRLIHCLCNMQTHFMDDRIPQIRGLLEEMRSMSGGFGYSGSHLFHLYRHYMREIFNDTESIQRNRPVVFPDSSSMTEQQMSTAKEIFNQFEEPKPEQVSEMKQVMEPVLKAVVIGVFRVEYHLYVLGERHDVPYRVPPQLETDGFVYVRERFESVED